jgi:hypothetical protein
MLKNLFEVLKPKGVCGVATLDRSQVVGRPAQAESLIRFGRKELILFWSKNAMPNPNAVSKLYWLFA